MMKNDLLYKEAELIQQRNYWKEKNSKDQALLEELQQQEEFLIEKGNNLTLENKRKREKLEKAKIDLIKTKKENEDSYALIKKLNS